jgi:hypothetical protein
MTTDASPQHQIRFQLWALLGIWLVVSIAKTWTALPSLSERLFPDPDDAMRLLQVRDWLAGQSWWDVTQYRLNAPAGGPMHWSRLIDLPIAAVELIARPFVGQNGAETVALVAVPSMTLVAAMLLVQRIAWRLMDGPAALLAVLATPASLGAMKQMRILRIDHHGWQIVMALAGILAVLDERPRRSGIVAGLAMAVWLNISIEGLPFVAAMGAWYAFEWLRDAATGERLKTFLAILAGASLLLFALTHAPSTWLSFPHDAINAAHLTAFAVASLCSLLAVRSSIGNRRIRFGAAAMVGVASIGSMFAVDPHVLQAPFAALDPLVRDLWYNAVDEGQPIWKLSVSDAAAAMAQPLVGLAGAFLALRKAPAERREGWLAFAWLLFASSVASVCVVREATTASVLAMPGTAFLADFALRRARTVSWMPVRAVATAGSICIMTPAYALPASLTPPDPRFVRAIQSSDKCITRSQVEHLDALPPSNLAVPLDITPAIIAMTPHRAIASGYHRNVSGIHDSIVLFTGQPAQQRAVLAKRNIDYIVFCPRTPETLWWASHNKTGLAGLLNANKPPTWLEPVKVPGLRALKVWRVRKDMLGVSAKA